MRWQRSNRDSLFGGVLSVLSVPSGGSSGKTFLTAGVPEAATKIADKNADILLMTDQDETGL